MFEVGSRKAQSGGHKSAAFSFAVIIDRTEDAGRKHSLIGVERLFSGESLNVDCSSLAKEIQKMVK